ncbi:Olfactory receptor 1038 [Lemmus lemmus]
MTNNHQLAVPLFGLFFVIYFITVLGNLGLVVLIQVSHRLHTPMYFFLSNLSFLDVCFSSITIPKTLVNLLSQLQEVSFFGCMAQMGLFIIFASAECNVLPSMAYDRYTAICQPLLYHITMSRVRCLILVAGCYFGGFLNMVAVTSSLTQLSFCQPHVISHFFCDIPPLLALACSDPWVTQILVVGCGGFTLVTSESLLHLCFSPDRSCSVLWNNYVHIFAALSAWVSSRKSDGLSVLYHGDSYVKSSHLQFEKSGSESCPKENIEAWSLIYFASQKIVDYILFNKITFCSMFSLLPYEVLLRTT